MGCRVSCGEKVFQFSMIRHAVRQNAAGRVRSAFPTRGIARRRRGLRGPLAVGRLFSGGEARNAGPSRSHWKRFLPAAKQFPRKRLTTRGGTVALPNAKIRLPLGGRLTVRLQTLDLRIGVRIPASQPTQAVSACPANVTFRLDGNGPLYCNVPASPGARRNDPDASSGFRMPGIWIWLMYCPKQVCRP